ncbi:MAG TPA: ROK family protein [Spirochaetia bacterium]|nr:ROK family protein [Spirochaetia bacterium]
MTTVTKNAKEQRRENAYLLLTAIRETDGVSRNELAGSLGLSVPSVTKIVDYLSSLGLLVAEQGVSKINRKLPRYSFTGRQYAVLGVELRRTHVLGVCCDLGGEVLRRFAFDYTEDDLDRLIDLISSKTLPLVDEMRGSGRRVLGMGVGSPGIVDYEEGKLLMATEFHNWNGLLRSAEFERRIGVPVVIEQNPVAAAFGEKRVGAARGKRNLIYVTLADGIGSGIIYNDKIFKGGSHFPTELGHTSVDPFGPECVCGNRGCLEVFAKKAVIEAALSAASSGAERSELIQRAAHYIAAGIGNLISITGITTVIVGGSMVSEIPDLFALLEKLIPTRSFPAMERPMTVRRATLGLDSSAVGAALLVGEYALFNLESALAGNTEAAFPFRTDAVI